MTNPQKPVLLIGTATTCPDLEYITGFKAADPVVFLGYKGGKILMVPEMELGRALQSPAGIQAVTPDMLCLGRTRRRKLSEWAIALLKKYHIKSVTVPSFFPFGVAQKLQNAGFKLMPANGAIFPERAVKKAHEIKNIRESQQAAVIAMRAAIALIAGSEITHNRLLKHKNILLTSKQVKETITEILIRRNCICREVIVAGGAQAVNPHDTGDGPLPACQSIVMDIFPQHMNHGYWGDLTRSVVRGEPSPKLKRLYKAVKSAQHAALACLRPGVKCSTVHKAALREISRHGFKSDVNKIPAEGFIHSTGHGVGLSIHEDPSVSMNDTRLRAGNVITIEPGCYYQNIGGVRIEDTVVITSTGWRYLVPCEKKFEI